MSKKEILDTLKAVRQHLEHVLEDRKFEKAHPLEYRDVEATLEVVRSVRRRLKSKTTEEAVAQSAKDAGGKAAS